MNAEQALQEWIKTQSLPVSDVEEHGFINGYNWALKDNEPVAYVTGLNKFGTVMADTVLKVGTPFYTHPAKEQYKFGVDWSKDGNAVTVLKVYEGGVAEVVFTDYQEVTHPAKTLTDAEIDKLWHSDEFYEEWTDGSISAIHYNKFARAILRKASE